MQSTTRLHDGLAHAILQEAPLVFHDPIAFPTANGVFNTESDRRDRPLGRFLRGGEFPPTRFFRRWDDGAPVEEKAREAHILGEATAVRAGIALQLSQACILRLPCLGGTPEADAPGRIAHEEVRDRVALLLTAVVVLLVLGIGGAVERALRALMPKRGGWIVRPSRGSRTARHTLRLFGPEVVLGL